MTDLVFNKDGQTITNSLLVAQKFGKRHTHVLDAIRKIISDSDEVSNQPTENSARQMFVESQYIDEKGEERPLFIMNRDGFSLLVMGFTGKNAMRFKLEFIGAFNEMERKLKAYEKPVTQIDLIIQSAQLIKEQDKRISSVEDKVRQIEAKTTTRPDYYTIVGYATIHDMSVNLKQASSLGRRASELCKIRGMQMDECPDPRFGKVKMYPTVILDEVFALPIN